MEHTINQSRLKQFSQALAKLGYDVPEELLYDATVAIIRFVAGIESSRIK